jgi:hypothetical protein
MMTVEHHEDPQQDPGRARPVRVKRPWRTPRLVAQGTVTVKTLAAISEIPPSG